MANLEGAEDDLETLGKNLRCTLEPELQQSVEKNPGNPKANYELSEFYLAHNQPARAATYLEVRPADETVSRQLALARIRTKQFDAARQLLTGLAPTANDAETHALLAQTNEGSGLFAEAGQEYALASSENPQEAYFFGEGYEYVLAGKPSRAAL